MKKIVILSNHPDWTYNLRVEIIEALIKEGHKVFVVVGYGKKIDKLISMGCVHIDVPFNRHGKNLIEEFQLIKSYYKILNDIKPDVVLSYTIKPNLYGAFLCRLKKIPCIANITGLGTAVEYPGLMQRVLLKVYSISFKNIYKVFFQNAFNRDFFLKHKIVKNNYSLLPGSGVNVEKFSLLPFPGQDNPIEFVFISRIMKEKGILEYLSAARALKEKYPSAKFHICGFCEQAFEEMIKEYVDAGVVEYHGMIDDVRTMLSHCQCLVLPTYYPEGMSNVLLESASSGRVIITTDRPGCKEIIDDKINGYIVKSCDNEGLYNAMDRFYNLPYDQRKQMGLNGREKVVKNFDRRIVVNEYLNAIHSISFLNKK